MQRILGGSVITMLATDGKDKIEPTLAESSADAARIASPAGLSARVAMGTAAAPASALVVANREENNRGGIAALEPPPRQAMGAEKPSAPARRKLQVLVVEDNPTDIELTMHALQRGGFDAVHAAVQTKEEFIERLRHADYDIILADYNLPSWNGMETVEALREEELDIPVIVVSGYLGELRAVECIKQGAADYVLKDHLLRLPDVVGRALREKKLREEHRRDQEDLARSNRDLEQFAYVASHDLQEPLRMVAIYTQLLAERYKGKLDENADKYIYYAVDGATRMQILVQDLLAFSRVGSQGAEFKPTDCAAAVEIALRNLHAAVQESGARIECSPLLPVVADPSQLVQLFQNLIGNALKFRGSQAPVVRITAEQTKQEAIFSVTDNGIGIAPEHAELVFAIFKRLHSRAEYPGSGIGLAICKKIVERHGGKIWVESEPGHGCAFRFTLPGGKVGDLRTPR
jgi:signal transduction histidine kinase